MFGGIKMKDILKDVLKFFLKALIVSVLLYQTLTALNPRLDAEWSKSWGSYASIRFGYLNENKRGY